MPLRVRNEESFKAAVVVGVPDLIKQCCNCGMPFSRDNVFTPEGWAHTQREGMCEACHEDLVDFISGDAS